MHTLYFKFFGRKAPAHTRYYKWGNQILAETHKYLGLCGNISALVTLGPPYFMGLLGYPGIMPGRPTQPIYSRLGTQPGPAQLILGPAHEARSPLQGLFV
ncbi:hypothetical protein L873DRAFT_1809656 [Choiromyces venosus 120613-1]|uniref:Uncharacterized protein n=1 Tax=Choiromyces venosus 120613-1 TaxID=1336337 RepID=A0A3N4JH51_9PEZI|nr:hypothetical protein L873DRAFT_1809656 [Choiromyces venosus 120613-1]